MNVNNVNREKQFMTHRKKQSCSVIGQKSNN